MYFTDPPLIKDRKVSDKISAHVHIQAKPFFALSFVISFVVLTCNSLYDSGRARGKRREEEV